MSLQLLTSELGNLVQESKRKHTELRAAAEQSLDEVRSLRNTSEAQVAADLCQRPRFIRPFLIACSTKNAKFIGIAIVCLQRLITVGGVPPALLPEVLTALQEASSSGIDVQLKIIQALPFFLQNYGSEVNGDLLVALIGICTTLQASKNGIVNNTAAATLQQLVVSVFDKVVAEDRSQDEVATVSEIGDSNSKVKVRAAAYDAYRIFNDLCLLTEAQKPLFLKVVSIPQTFGLELIESILTNHAELFLLHEEQANVLRCRLMPFIISSMSEKLSFATTVRVGRILYTLLRHHLSILPSEGEVALGLLTHMLDNDSTLWRRALCMEVFRGIFAEAALIRHIYSLYDADSSRKKVLSDLVSAFVRLSSEKPSVIGLGIQSTAPTANPYQNEDDSANQAMLEAGGLGIISSPVANREHSSGISVEWSSMRVPCIDQLDKADAPAIPETYIYGLTLTCINTFSEGLAKFIIPLTALHDKSKRKKSRNAVPLNPLDQQDHPLYHEIKVCERIVDDCWPAIMATCSTFLNACLDADYFHGLVRSFQKFTHVAGLLRLSTPRDAFLTTLGKSAVPPHVFAAVTAPPPSIPNTPATEGHGIFNNAKGLLSVDSLTSGHSTLPDRTRQGSTDESVKTLNTRNLLSLRALLNLGIALGPTLTKDAWLIVLETLQQADFVIYMSSKGGVKLASSTPGKGPDQSTLLANMGQEVKLVEQAASKLFEGTVTFPDASFIEIIRAICTLFGVEFGAEDENAGEKGEARKGRSRSPTMTRKSSYSHRRVSSITINSASSTHGEFFALSKLSAVAIANVERLTTHDPVRNGWDDLSKELITAATSDRVAPKVRQRSTEVLVGIVLEASNYASSLGEEVRAPIQRQLLNAFWGALTPLQLSDRRVSITTIPTDIDVHFTVLEALKKMLEQCGDNLADGWDVAFQIISSVFIIPKDSLAQHDGALSTFKIDTRSPRLVRSAFGSLELICSDFLTSLPDNQCFLVLINTLYQFSTQEDDLNIALTTVTFFWVLSDYLAKRDGQIELKSDVMSEDSEEKLNQLAYSGDRKESNAALWLMLLLRLTAVTTDERPELRNTAIQTLLRIFDANGDYLSAEAWSMCFHHVIFKMLIAVASHLTGDSQSYAASDRAAWIDTTIVVLAGVSSLLSNYIHVLASHESFSSCWASLLDNFEHLLDLNKLEVSTAVFKALHQILEQANNGTQSSAALDEDAVKLAWDLWTNEVPTAHGVPGEKSDENNQDCLLAYVLCFQEIYRLARANVDVEKTTKVLRMLNGTVRTAQLSSYSSDVDYLTPLQTKVLESFNMLRTDIDGVPAAIIDSTADLCRLAFDDPKAQVAGKVSKPTYVALSREASIFLAGTIKAHYQDNSIYSSGSVLKALDALSMPIKLKYAFPIKTTKNIQPCRLSTVTSLDIIRSALPYLTEAQPPSSILHPIWDTVIQIYSAILSADTTGIPVSTILEDEQLDILYSRDLAGLIIPALGSEEIPDHTRRKFTAALFRASIIHEPAHGEIPEDGRELLARIYDPLRGRTVRLPPTARTKMAYVAFHQLADLVAIYPIGAGPAGSKAANASSDSHSSTVAPERVLLARAASPYFILRCALTLRAYYADQPLRGMMPQPISQRAELLKVLERMVDMQAEDEGIPDLKGVESTGGKHLCRLFPLLVKVAAVRNGNDAKVKDLTAQALQRVGWGFGL